MVVASAASGGMTEAVSSDTQTTITGRLAVYYPMDHPAGYSLIDNVGEVRLIPGPAGAGDLYRYAGTTIEVTGNLVSQDGRRTLYMEKWVPAEVSASYLPPTTVTGTQTLLILLIEFPDIAGTHLTPYFQNLITGLVGSMNRYFGEDSYGIIAVTGNPTSRWYTLPHPSTDYNVHTWQSCSPENANEYYRLADDAFRLVDPYVNYGAYNRFLIVTARDSVWGCTVRSGAHDINTNEGTIRGYAFVSENSGLTVYAHEFSHDLGLPDLYDYSGQDPYGFIDSWDLMGTSGASPQHHSAWSKMWLGWIPEREVADFDLRAAPPPLSLTVTIDRTERPLAGPVPGHAHALRIREEGNSFYLVETRQKIGFDANIPSNAPDHGVLITYCQPDLGDGEGIVREVDQNPNTRQISDGDALWQVGQVYSQFNEDGIGWAVAIQSWTGTGFVVVVSTHPLYPVTFTQSGLPSDVSPSVQCHIDSNPAFSVTVPTTIVVFGQGHTIYYDYQQVIFSWSGGRYVLASLDPPSPRPVAGPLTIIGYYVAHYTVTFQETGISYGTRWGVTVAGTHYSTTDFRLSVNELVGTVDYRYDSPVGVSLVGSYACTSGCSGSVSGPGTVMATYAYRPIIIRPNGPPRISSLTPDKPSPQSHKSTITWVCKAGDPEGDQILYKFQVQGAFGRWVTVQDWSTSNVFSWTPSSAGLYNIRCLVRDGNHAPASGYDDSRTVYRYRIT